MWTSGLTKEFEQTEDTPVIESENWGRFIRTWWQRHVSKPAPEEELLPLAQYARVRLMGDTIHTQRLAQKSHLQHSTGKVVSGKRIVDDGGTTWHLEDMAESSAAT